MNDTERTDVFMFDEGPVKIKDATREQLLEIIDYLVAEREAAKLNFDALSRLK